MLDKVLRSFLTVLSEAKKKIKKEGVTPSLHFFFLGWQALEMTCCPHLQQEHDAQ